MIIHFVHNMFKTFSHKFCIEKAFSLFLYPFFDGMDIVVLEIPLVSIVPNVLEMSQNKNKLKILCNLFGGLKIELYFCSPKNRVGYVKRVSLIKNEVLFKYIEVLAVIAWSIYTFINSKRKIFVLIY